MKKNYSITIITPFYDGNSYIAALTNCISENVEYLIDKNLDVNIEMVIVNDSPGIKIDVTKVKLPECVSLNIVTHRKNSGIHQARITGLKYANGDYILFLDQDDHIVCNFIYSQLTKIGDCDLIVSNAYIEDTKHVKNILYKNVTDAKRISDVNFYIKGYNQIRSPGQCLIRKRAIPDEWTKYVLNINGSDDLFLWILMLYQNSKVRYNEDILYTHMFTGTNLSDSLEKMLESTQEVATYLRLIGYIPKRVCSTLMRAHKLNLDIKNMSIFPKIYICLKNIDIIIYRLYWKIRRSI